MNTFREEDYKHVLVHHVDFIFCFILFRKAKSLKKINMFGHVIYVRKDRSTNFDQISRKKLDIMLAGFITYANIVYNFSGNSIKEKEEILNNGLEFVDKYKDKITSTHKDFAIYVLSKYLHCSYFSEKNKNRIKNIYDSVLNTNIE